MDRATLYSAHRLRLQFLRFGAKLGITGQNSGRLSACVRKRTGVNPCSLGAHAGGVEAEASSPSCALCPQSPGPPFLSRCRYEHISRLQTWDCKNVFPPEGSSSGKATVTGTRDRHSNSVELGRAPGSNPPKAGPRAPATHY